MADLLTPMAEHVKGRAIVAVCDITEYPDLARRESAANTTMIIYRDGREVARSEGNVTNVDFETEMNLLGLNASGGRSQSSTASGPARELSHHRRPHTSNNSGHPGPLRQTRGHEPR